MKASTNPNKQNLQSEAWIKTGKVMTKKTKMKRTSKRKKKKENDNEKKLNEMGLKKVMMTLNAYVRGGVGRQTDSFTTKRSATIVMAMTMTMMRMRIRMGIRMIVKTTHQLLQK